MEASWTCTNIEMSYRDSKGGRLTLLTEERGIGKADFLYTLSGLCVHVSELSRLRPCQMSSQKKSFSGTVASGCKQEYSLDTVNE